MDQPADGEVEAANEADEHPTFFTCHSMMKRKEALGNGRQADRLALPIWAQALGVLGSESKSEIAPPPSVCLFFSLSIPPTRWPPRPFDSVVPLVAWQTLAGSTSLALDVTWPTG